jgi:hypothetical protein
MNSNRQFLWCFCALTQLKRAFPKTHPRSIANYARDWKAHLIRRKQRPTMNSNRQLRRGIRRDDHARAQCEAGEILRRCAPLSCVIKALTTASRLDDGQRGW